MGTWVHSACYTGPPDFLCRLRDRSYVVGSTQHAPGHSGFAWSSMRRCLGQQPVNTAEISEGSTFSNLREVIMTMSEYEERLRAPAPSLHQTFTEGSPARTRGSRPTKAASPRETDSPLEGSGFEPSVPLPRLSSIRAVRAEIIGRSADVFRRDREFDVSALQGRLSTSSQSQCSTDPGPIAGTWHRPLFLTRDRWFESGSLQRRDGMGQAAKEMAPSSLANN